MLKKVKKLIGIIVIFTPGPAIVIIPVGLAVLATEFVWAEKLLQRFKNKINNVRNGF
jgi:hypothetical protein